MTKQQFLDKLIYESDRIIYDEYGNINTAIIDSEIRNRLL